LRHRDGHVVWTQTVRVAVPPSVADTPGAGPDSAQPRYLVAVIVDITERKQHEEALRQSEARQRTILGTSLDAIFLTDAAGQVVECTPAAQKLLGLPAAATRCNLGDLLLPGWPGQRPGSSPTLALAHPSTATVLEEAFASLAFPEAHGLPLGQRVELQA